MDETLMVASCLEVIIECAVTPIPTPPSMLTAQLLASYVSSRCDKIDLRRTLPVARGCGSLAWRGEEAMASDV
jgi:hypothetical protein